MKLDRRTLVALTAVAAMSGGAAGGVASTVTTPDAASAQVKVLGKYKTPEQRILDNTKNLLIVSTERHELVMDRLTALEQKLDTKAAEIQQLNSQIAAGLRAPTGVAISSYIASIYDWTQANK